MVARACLVSTFFEDGIRMWTQWNEQREYMDISWGCGWFLATMFVVINLIGQLGGVIMVMGRLKVEIACGVLFFIVVLQVRFPHTDLIRAETNVSNLIQPHFSKIADDRLQYFMGRTVLVPQLGLGRSLVVGLG